MKKRISYLLALLIIGSAAYGMRNEKSVNLPSEGVKQRIECLKRLDQFLQNKHEELEMIFDIYGGEELGDLETTKAAEELSSESSPLQKEWLNTIRDPFIKSLRQEKRIAEGQLGNIKQALIRLKFRDVRDVGPIDHVAFETKINAFQDSISKFELERQDWQTKEVEFKKNAWTGKHVAAAIVTTAGFTTAGFMLYLKYFNKKIS